MTPPASKEWMEIGVHPELCVGTVARALSKVNNTVQNELETLKVEGKFNEVLSSYNHRYAKVIQLRRQVLFPVMTTNRIDRCNVSIFSDRDEKDA